MEEFTSALIYAPAKAFGDGDAARDVRARVRCARAMHATSSSAVTIADGVAGVGGDGGSSGGVKTGLYP